MSPFVRFLMRVPLVFAGLALLAAGLIYLTALPAIQTTLAAVALD